MIMKTYAWTLALVALTWTAGCNKAPAQNPATAAPVTVAETAAEATVPVQAGKVTQAKLPATLDLSGTLVADEVSEVAASAPGIVTEVMVDVGTRVKKGDVLVRIDRRDAAMRVAQATASTAQATARLGMRPGDSFKPERTPEVQVAREALELAETEAKRAKALVEGGSGAQSTLDQARARAEQARGQYEAAMNGARTSWAALQAARAAQDLTEKASTDTDVRAPFDGVVNEKRISTGEYAMPGKVIAVLMRDNPLRLRIDVPEGDTSRIKQDGEVLLTVSAWPGRVFHAAIKRIGAAVKAQSRTLTVEAEVLNDDMALKPGFFVRASVLLGGEPRETLLVPPAAIGNSGSAARVFVLQGGHAVEKIVSVGRTWQGLVEVRGALQPSDTVAISGLEQLSDGARVSVK
jgi:RND family efflux transporter MFP subunit